MATMNGTTGAGAPTTGPGGAGYRGRFSLRGKRLATGAAVLGLACLLTVSGLWLAAGSPTTARPADGANVALAQTLASSGFVEFGPGEASAVTEPANGGPSVARARTLAGAGFLEFQPGELPNSDTRASLALAGVGPREYLAGEDSVAVPLPVAPAAEPAPLFGPQP